MCGISEAPPSLAPEVRRPSLAVPYLALGVAIIVVSGAAIIISFTRAAGMPAAAIAAWRLVLASAVLMPFAVARSRKEWRGLSGGELTGAVLAGVFLALHFSFWIASLDHTSVMSSVVFVSTNPLFVALASLFILREPLRRGTIIGIAVAIGGGTIIGYCDMEKAGVNSLRGDLLALAGAVALSAYLLIGRRLRKRISLLGYIGIVYSSAAIVLLLIALAMRVPMLGYSWQAYALVAALAAGPQLIGHTSYNYALKYLSATFITVTILAEPIGATLLAMPLLRQIPKPASLVGGALILMGIFLAAREEARPVAPGQTTDIGGD